MDLKKKYGAVKAKTIKILQDPKTVEYLETAVLVSGIVLVLHPTARASKAFVTLAVSDGALKIYQNVRSEIATMKKAKSENENV
ncbi:MAG: hypothetical protein DRG78_03455 [Epsilonproteobacteria bacterium]|nr:MAG: hypothetical protein DRG78_03455 [Campylobacterota bacterium]